MASEDARPITKEDVCEIARRLHPAAFVYTEPGQPVLVDDGHCWLLFFEQGREGMRYACDGETMPPVEDQVQLEQILVTVAATYRRLDEATRERGAQHVATLAGLDGIEIYTQARRYARTQMTAQA